jgi:hypothetical protein
MIFDVLFDVFLSEVQPRCCPADPPPFPFGFTANTDHQRVGELRLDSSPQSGSAPLIGFWSRAVESTGGDGFAVGPDLSLFLSEPLLLHQSWRVPETGRLYSVVTHHTYNTLHVL